MGEEEEWDGSLVVGEVREAPEQPAASSKGAQPLVAPPVLFLGLIAVGITVQVYWSIEGWFPWWARLLGLVGTYLSFRWGVGAVKLLKEHQTAVSPYQASSQLLTKGPFARSRNPIYLSLTGCHLGTALIADNPWILGTGLLYFLLLHPLVIRYEEAYLTRTFGDAYETYKTKVRRWL